MSAIIPSFWTRTARLQSATPISTPPKLLKQTSQLGQYHQTSQAYLAKLGFPPHQAWSKTNNTYKYENIVVNNLSHNEQLLLEILFTKRGSTVSFGEIIDALWPNNEEITNWAVTKQVERLRRKLKLLNINNHVIQTQRRLGYSLT